MPLKFLFFLTLFFVHLQIASAQTWSWAKSYGAGQEDIGRSVTGKGEHLFFGGSFNGKFNMGGTEVSSAGAADFFLSKKDLQGNMLWVRTGSSEGKNAVQSIKTDEIGGLFVSGYYTNQLTIGHQQFAGHLTKNGFVSRWGQDGGLIWFKTLSGNGQNEVTAISKGAQNSVLATGFFSQTVQIENNQFTASGGSDLFVAKYALNGSLLWANHFGGTQTDRGTAIATGSENSVYVGGYYTGQITFGQKQLKSNDKRRGFLFKLDENGNVVWAQGFESSGLSAVSAVRYAQGKLYVSGYFTGDLTTDNGQLTATAGKDGFIARFDTDGNLEWMQSIQSPKDLQIHDIQLTAGKLYATGSFSTSFSKDGVELQSAAEKSAFIAEFTLHGEMTHAYASGGSGSVLARSLYLENDRKYYLTGSFQNQVHFGTNHLSNASDEDIFLAKFDRELLSSSGSLVENDIAQPQLRQLSGQKFYLTGNSSHDSFAKTRLSVFDLNGRFVYSMPVQSNQFFELSHLPSGIYFYHLFTNETEMPVSGKLLIQSGR